MTSFEDRVRIMKGFFDSIGPEQAAQYTVRLQDCVEGQLANLQLWQKEFRKLVENKTKP